MIAELQSRPSSLKLSPRATMPAAQAGPASSVAAPPPTAAQETAQAFAVTARACAAGRPDMIATIAATALQIPEAGLHQRSIWTELLGFQPVQSIDVAGDSPWLMRRIDGAMVGLFTLRANGSIGHSPHPNEARWTLADGCLNLGDRDGGVKTRFELAGRIDGRRVFIGRHLANGVVHLLTEADCAYSRMRTIDPELTGPMAGLLETSQFVDARMPRTPAVMLAAARTGSHLLVNLLNSSGRVFFDNELFNPDMISVFGADLPRDRKDGLDILRASDPVRFAKAMMSRSHHVDGRSLDGIATRGFKFFPEQSRTILDWTLDTPEVRVVHLYRANLLAEFSSYAAAHRDGHWVGGPGREARKKLEFDRERFERFVAMKQAYLERVRERLAGRAGPWQEIEYSDINRDSVQRLLGFLTDEDANTPLSALGLKQQLSERVIDRFERPDDVWASLRSMQRESWADIEMPEVKGF